MTATDRTAQLKQVYQTIEKLQGKLDALQQAQSEPIAIVGQSCRFPHGANSPEAYWELLRDGRDAITVVPPERWEADAYFDPRPDRPGKIATRWGGFLDNVAGFDARFFGISPREAAQMDPQQRLLLEVAWEALEAAGQPAGGLAGSATGIYIGLLNSEYGWLQMRDPASLDVYSGTGTSSSVASGRLSYFLGVHGPSITLDTACSSSLYAIHLACQGLRSRECDLALAGGVSLILSPLALMPFSRMGLLASDGRCKTLDASADGFGSGEGCALLVLKRLSEAQAAGDPILAVIRGSAINQDGRTNVLSAPNGRSQEAVIRQALTNAGVHPHELSFIELHGTGTSLGDPIETDALRAVYKSAAPGDAAAPAGPVHLGAVKSNIGHTGAAAGVAGVIKAILALQHETIPPNLHFTTLNPHVNLTGTPFAIPTQPIPWPRGEAPRLAGISAFGWSGTNAHLVLSDPPAPSAAPPQPAFPVQSQAYVIPLAARSEAALRDVAAALRDHLRSPAGAAQPLADITHTTSVRRSHHAHRLAVVGETHAQVADRLRAYLDDPASPEVAAGRHHGTRRRKLVFVFSPHGAQWLGMGRALWQQSPVFRAAIEACQAAMQPHVTWTLSEKLMAGDDAWLDEIDVLQPFLFALQVGLASVWRAWGVRPDAAVGHSMGEVAAAHFAGVLSLDDAARIICRRTQLLRAASGEGAMGVVELSYAAAQAAIAPYAGRLHIAASNSPRSTILSGEPAALEALFDELQAQEIFCGWGVADVASHSPRMAALGEQLREAVGAVAVRPAQVPLYSTVTGSLDDGRQFDAGYWVRHLNQPVLFAEAVRALAASGHELFLEIGPGPVLGPAIEEGLQDLQVEGVTLTSLRRNAGDPAVLLETLGRLYTLGVPVAWNKVYPSGKAVSLPAYPWQRERFWLEADTATLTARPAGLSGSLPGAPLAVAGEPGKTIWQGALDRRQWPQPFQHRLFGRPVLPASAAIEMALAAGQGHGARNLASLIFVKGLVLREEAPWTETQMVLDPPSAAGAAFRLYSLIEGQWQPHFTGRLELPQVAAQPVPNPAARAGLEEALPNHLDEDALYRAFEALGIEYGPDLRTVSEIRWGPETAVASARLDERTIRELAAGNMPAAVIEPALQAFAWLVSQLAGSASTLYAPASIERVTWRQPAVAPAWATVNLIETNDDAIIGCARLVAPDGAVVMALEGIRFEAVGTAQPEHAADQLYQVVWEPVEQPAERAPLAGRWLIFADEHGIGQALAQSIAREGGQALVVARGIEYAALADGRGSVRPEAAEDYQALMRQAPPASLKGIVHLWSVDQDDPQWDAARRLAHRSEAVVRLVQAVKQAAPDAAVPIWFVTAGAHAAGGAMVVPEQATVWGLGYVLAEEHHELWGGLIDCDPAGDPGVSAEHLLRFLSARPAEDRIAFRGDAWLTARLARLPQAESGHGAPASPLFRPDGAYLVTGGFGDIALAVAQWAVGQGARRLILLGRTELPPRDQWRALPPESAAARRAAAIQKLEALGAAVQWAAMDVGDRARLAGFLDQYAAEGWPAIRGVIHAAAVIDDRLLIELDPDSLRRVVHPKASGAWNLHQYFLDRPLDFFVMFSSSGSLMGAAGQASYAAANAYLDALAHARRAAGAPALSINWGFWKDLGFALTPGGRRAVAYMRGFGMLPFEAPVALVVLGQLMSRPAPAQAAAMRVHWDDWRKHSRLVGVPPFLRGMEQAEAGEAPEQAPAVDLRERLLRLEPGLPRLRQLREHIRGQLAAVLRVEPASIDDDTALGSLGIDSFSAIELRNRFERSLGLRLSATLVWNYPTIAAMAPHLAEKMGLDGAASEAGGARAPETLDDDLAEFLAQAEALSDDDLRKLLNGGAAHE